MKHRPLVLAVALSMAAFLLLIVTAQMQEEIGGQTAELPPTPTATPPPPRTRTSLCQQYGGSRSRRPEPDR